MQDLIGFVLPPIIDLINTKIANTKLRFWIAILICVVIGTIANLEDITDLNNLLGSIALIFTESQIIYKTYWEKSAIRDRFYPDRA